jgi:hypothetical protein
VTCFTDLLDVKNARFVALTREGQGKALLLADENNVHTDVLEDAVTVLVRIEHEGGSSFYRWYDIEDVTLEPIS